MARFFGKVGYVDTIETSKGIYEEKVIDERDYYGDVIINRTNTQYVNEQINDNINVNNSISIMADAYAYNNFFLIKYVEWNGVKWKVKSVEIQRPRLLLTIGDVYNGVTS